MKELFDMFDNKRSVIKTAKIMMYTILFVVGSCLINPLILAYTALVALGIALLYCVFLIIYMLIDD